MKVLYTSDIHGNHKALESVLKHSKKSKPDLVVVSGDLINTSFASEKERSDYYAAYDVLNKIRTAQIEQGNTELAQYSLGTIADAILKTEGASDDIVSVAQAYMNSIPVAAKGMKAQYAGLEKILSESKTNYLVLPGNYDNDEILNAIFKEKDMHKKSAKAKNVKISGYGGANVIAAAAVPMELILDYAEGFDQEGKLHSESRDFFSKEKPDIIMAHNPPYGACDVVGVGESRVEGTDNSGEHVGGKGLEEYIKKNSPKIVLCGHIHEARGIEKLKDTYIVNAGSLGEIGPNGGTFYELDIDDSTGALKGASLYQITNLEKGEITKRADYKLENGELKPYNVSAEAQAESLEARVDADKKPAEQKAQKIDMRKIPCQTKFILADIYNQINDYKRLSEKINKPKKEKPGLLSEIWDSVTYQKLCPREKYMKQKQVYHRGKLAEQLFELEKNAYSLSQKHKELEPYVGAFGGIIEGIASHKEGDYVGAAESVIKQYKPAVAKAYSKQKP